MFSLIEFAEPCSNWEELKKIGSYETELIVQQKSKESLDYSDVNTDYYKKLKRGQQNNLVTISPPGKHLRILAQTESRTVPAWNPKISSGSSLLTARIIRKAWNRCARSNAHQKELNVVVQAPQDLPRQSPDHRHGMDVFCLTAIKTKLNQVEVSRNKTEKNSCTRALIQLKNTYIVGVITTIWFYYLGTVKNYFEGKKSNDASIETTVKDTLKQASNRIYLKVLPKNAVLLKIGGGNKRFNIF
ncbi:unnamed protein product [Allacma fusca]|uniref:Uncharacterized protein n=1 Tax=Allacma fusca TaxID=39272 RepID=A0A8J2P5N3_9HEXA|nr:unnamed protein product [Allacma fusca]